MTRIKSKLIASLIAIAMVLALVFTSLPAFTSAQAVGSSDFPMCPTVQVFLRIPFIKS